MTWIMYPKLLVVIFILLMTTRFISDVVEKPKLAKAAIIGVILLVATSLVLWVLMGLSPVPDWATKLVRRAISTGTARLGS